MVFDRFPKWIIVVGRVLGFLLIVVGLGGVPSAIRQWHMWLNWIGDHMDHDIARWTFVISGGIIIITIWAIPFLVERWKSRKGVPSETLRPPIGGGTRLYEWIARIEEAIEERNAVRNHATAIRWAEKTRDSLENFLGLTERANSLKQSFSELVSKIREATGRPDRARLLDRAVQFLKDYKTKVTVDDLS